MGYIRHHAIVVVGWDADRVQKAHAKAIELEMQATDVVVSHTNAYYSFMVAPDGSKEGWPESDAGDIRRDAFVAWMKDEARLWVEWAEVELDVDGDSARLTRHNLGDPPDER